MGGAPLSWVAGDGDGGLVNMLLEHGDIDPDTPDNQYGRTPLSWAAGNGYKGIAKMLLEPNIAAHPPPLATGNGGEGLADVLLERGNIDTCTNTSYN